MCRSMTVSSTFELYHNHRKAVMTLRTFSAALFAALAAFSGCTQPSRITLPGPTDDGRTLLPNGWSLSPAGKHLTVGELPMNMAITPDGKFALVNNNGTREQGISVIDIDRWEVIQTFPLRKSWLGLKIVDGGRTVLASGGNDNRIIVLAFAGGRLSLSDSIVIGKPWPDEKIWVAGVDADADGRQVYCVGKENRMLYKLDRQQHKVVATLLLPAIPYSCLLSPSGDRLFVTLWGGASVAVVDPATLMLKSRIAVGEHPSHIVASADGKRLFVSNANNNTVSVIDVDRERVSETLVVGLTPNAPPGSTPNAAALSVKEDILYVANADNNCLAVVNVSEPGESRSLGFIPVGWYPTAVAVTPGGVILVANGKGAGSRANPGGPNPTRRSRTEEYIGSLFHGTVSSIAPPAAERLAQYSRSVYANSPYNDQRALTPGRDSLNPVPYRVGGSSPIKHVFYIIKENRTYDQVFGDLPQGNGDSSLCLFPEHVTPNLHALVREFVLLDNLFADAEVSADGHNWSMGAYATDYTEKTWPTSYGGRGGEYEYEGGYPIVFPAAGYLWDNCHRHGVSYRSYGEFAQNAETPGDSARGLTPALEGHVAPFYRGWDLQFSDILRVGLWQKEFDEYERNGLLPQFQIIKLPNDHTEGTRKGSLSPRAYVAQNDLAVGMVIERISHSRYWKESAIFIIEDDAQNGPDHVDAHRTEALVISPYTKRGFVDSDLYSTSSMVRTMELILGMPALSQYDAASTPMYNSFTQKPTLTPFTHRSANIDLEERNPSGAFGQERSEEMDFTLEDRIPDVELNEIVWKSVRGRNSDMPAPVRSAFVRVME
jgi:YVTN family beta-propeller protein